MMFRPLVEQNQWCAWEVAIRDRNSGLTICSHRQIDLTVWRRVLPHTDDRKWLLTNNTTVRAFVVLPSPSNPGMHHRALVVSKVTDMYLHAPRTLSFLSSTQKFMDELKMPKDKTIRSRTNDRSSIQWIANKANFPVAEDPLTGLRAQLVARPSTATHSPSMVRVPDGTINIYGANQARIMGLNGLAW